MRAPEVPFFVTGGTLRSDAPCYVERQADRDLLDGLLRGELCYVLTSRQMGKSSLMVRTAARLRERRVSVVVLDLTAVGQNVTPEQWYDGLLTGLGRQLQLEAELDVFWQRHARLSPVQRFMSALRDVALARCPGPLVVFVDESDIVRSLPFSSDEFFAAVRECHNRRAEDAEFARLTFCLLGVATPSDLIRDTRLTPFNIGRRIELNDFTPEEAAPLAQGLTGPDSKLETRTSELLLQRVLDWTAGHPYLTQRLCQALAAALSGPSPPPVLTRTADELCDDLFLSLRARERDDNLVFVRERLLGGTVDRAALLDLYAKVRRGRRVPDDEGNPLVSELLLAGAVRRRKGRLEVRNRIYSHVFDRGWIVANTPAAERRRQRMAFRRGVMGASAAAAALVILLSVPVFKESAPALGTTSGEFTNVRLAVVNGRPVIPPELLQAAVDTREARTNALPLLFPPAPALLSTGEFTRPIRSAATTERVNYAISLLPFLMPPRLEPPRPAEVRAIVMTNLIASTAPAIPVPSPPAPAASPPLIFAPTGAAEAQSAQSSESGPPSPPWVATVLEARGKVEFSRAGAKLWDEVPRSSTNRLVLYPGDRLRTHEKSRAVLRLSDSNVVTVAEHSVLQVAPPPNKRTGFDLLRGMMYFFQRDKSAEPKIKTPAAGASIRG